MGAHLVEGPRRRLLDDLESGDGTVGAQPTEPLTIREEEVLNTVAQGWTNREIADDLHTSPSTVKTHLASLMRKFGARSRAEIAMWAYETKRVRP